MRSPRLSRILRVSTLGAAFFFVSLDASPSALSVRDAASGESAAIVPYTGEWHYRWGDSPQNAEGKFVYSLPQTNFSGFAPLPALDKLSGRAGAKFLWLGTRLSGDVKDEPTLYLRGVDQLVEAYVDGECVYRFGAFEGPSAHQFLGYKAHYIPLGENFQGKTLTFRIWSDHVNIGIYGEPMLGPKTALMETAIRRDLATLGMGVIMSSLGMFVFLLFLANRKERGYLMYGLFALTVGLYFIASSPSRILIVNSPLGWVHVELFMLYTTPIFLLGYFETIFGKGRFHLVRWIQRCFMVYAPLAFVLVGFFHVPVMKTLLPGQILFLVAVGALSVRAIRGAWDGRIDERIFTAGFVAASVAAFYDILGAMGLLSRANAPLSHIGIFLFTLSIGLILARRFVEVHERLGKYSTVLQLSLAQVGVLEQGQQAQVALGELIRLLSARCAFLFLSRPEGSERAGELELAAMRDASGAGLRGGELSKSMDGLVLRTDVVESVRAKRKPLITSSAGKKNTKRGAMAAPLLMRDELIGVVYLEAAVSRRPFDEADLAILLGLCTQLSITIVTTRAIRAEVKATLQTSRLEKQGALLDAVGRMANGDIETPITVADQSEFADLGHALDGMRKDVQAKIHMLEAKNAEVGVLNDELRRRIEERTMNLLQALLGDQKTAPTPQFRKGEVIGDRYRVERILGQGAMGVVYEVARVVDQKHFALKVLSGEVDKASVARFIREANILARLNHPNLVGIVDVDVTSLGHLHLVMELFAGQTLEKFRDREVGWVLLALGQMAEGLAAVHESGIVHRDLKPANVLVALREDGTPEVKLADFGISTLAGEEPPIAKDGNASVPSTDDEKTREWARSETPSMSVTKTGAMVGTPNYMAPELARRGKTIQSSSDLFSLGIIAYELLVKTRPFAVPAVFAAAAGGGLPKPMGLNAVQGLSPKVTALLERCLLESPEERPTAREIADAIAVDLRLPQSANPSARPPSSKNLVRSR